MLSQTLVNHNSFKSDTARLAAKAVPVYGTHPLYSTMSFAESPGLARGKRFTKRIQLLKYLIYTPKRTHLAQTASRMFYCIPSTQIRFTDFFLEDVVFFSPDFSVY